MKKNVAIIISRLCIGGAEKIAAMLSEYIYEKGNNVFLFVDTHQNKNNYNYKGKLINLNFDSETNFLKNVNLSKHINKIKKLKKKYKIDITISFMERYNFINILSRYNDRVIISIHTYLKHSLKEYGLEGIIVHMYIKWLYNKADDIVVLTNEGKKELINKFNIVSQKIKVINNPINFDEVEIKKNVSLLDWKYGNNTIINIGRLENAKAQWHLIRAFNEVHKKHKDSQLLILGTGKLLKYLQQIVSELKLVDSVHFLGFNRNVYNFLLHSKVFVLTSKFEGFPNVILDALACGVSVISVDCEVGPRDILSPHTSYERKLDKIEYAKYGILIPSIDGIKYESKIPLTKSEKLLSKAMVNVISNNNISKHYSKMALKRAKYFDINIIWSKWDNLIK